MYGSLSKNIITAIIAALPVVTMVSCSGNQQKSENEVKAEALLKNVQSLYEEAKYDDAMTMIDSLMKVYPGELDVQRRALHVKTLINEKLIFNDSIANEELYAQSKQMVDSLGARFKFMKEKDMVEGYYISKSLNNDALIKTTGLMPRVGEDGSLSLVSSLYGHSIKHTRLSATANNSTVTTVDVPVSNDRNYRFNDNGVPVEMVTFTMKECDSLCHFIMENAGTNIRLTFESGKKKHATTLSKKTKEIISETYEYSHSLQDLKKAEMDRVKFAKKLQLSRKQIKQTATNIQGNRE